MHNPVNMLKTNEMSILEKLLIKNKQKKYIRSRDSERYDFLRSPGKRISLLTDNHLVHQRFFCNELALLGKGKSSPHTTERGAR